MKTIWFPEFCVVGVSNVSKLSFMYNPQKRKSQAILLRWAETRVFKNGHARVETQQDTKECLNQRGT